MAEYEWKSAKSGSWNTAAKWSPAGGPQVQAGLMGNYSMDQAVFDTGSSKAYTVTGTAIANGLSIIGDHVTFSDFTYRNPYGSSFSETKGAVVTIAAGSYINLSSHDEAGGAIQVNHATLNVYGGIAGSGLALANHATALVSGAGAALTPIVGLVSIDATSSLTLQDGAKLQLVGGGIAGTITASGAGTSLTYILTPADGTIVDGAGATVTAPEIDGTVKMAGGSLSLTTLGAGGTISGAGTVSSAFTNDGTVTASGGTLTLAGAVSGTGGLAIGSHSTLVLADATGENITFSGADAKLMLAPSATATGFLGGLARGDAIDIQGASITRVTETADGANTVLKAFAGATLVDSFDVTGHIASGSVSLASDHAGGTVLTYDPSTGGHGGFPGGGHSWC